MTIHLDPKSKYFTAEGIFVYAKFFGCGDLFPLISFKGLTDGMSLYFLECHSG